MEESGSKYIHIKLELETGRLVDILDDKGKEAEPIRQEEVISIYNGETGFRHLGTILHTHSSPGCITIIIAGKAFRLCNFPGS